jgi:hypothetical protein
MPYVWKEPHEKSVKSNMHASIVRLLADPYVLIEQIPKLCDVSKMRVVRTVPRMTDEELWECRHHKMCRIELARRMLG